MSGPARIVRGAAVLALLFLLALLVLSKGWLEPADLLIFDSRFGGYSLTEAQRYLEALGAEGRLLYLGIYRWLDTLFPVLTTLALGGVIWLNTALFNSAIRLLLLCAPIAYVMLDLGENALVAELLRADFISNQSVVDRASQLTQAKWLMLMASSLLAAGSWWIGRRKDNA